MKSVQLMILKRIHMSHVIASCQKMAFRIFSITKLISIISITGIEERITYSVRLSERISDIS